MRRASISGWVILFPARFALSIAYYLGEPLLGFRAPTVLAMAVGEFPALRCRVGEPCSLVHTTSVAAIPCPPLMMAPETALFLAIDLDCSVQNMQSSRRPPPPEDDHVTYFVNRDAAGWVAQRVTRRVYLELKLECTRNRSRDGQKARDDWICVYCKGSFPSKLRLTDHRVSGCPRGPVDSTGARLELPVYPNLKTAKQGKDLKLALQRCDGAVWDTLRHNSVWFDLCPELREVTCPPPGAKVQERHFMVPTLEFLEACPAPAGDPHPQGKAKPQRPPRQHTAPPAAASVVDLDEEGDEDNEVLHSQNPKKRSHAHMAGGSRVYHSSRQFRAHKPMHSAEGGPSTRHSSEGAPRRTPTQPMVVTPIQTRSPSPERVAILPPPTTPAPQVQVESPRAPISPVQTAAASQDVAVALRKDRQQFYVKVASAARLGVKMEIPKPVLKPPLQPPGMFYLLACGLLTFDLENGEFHEFQELVHKWRNDPCFIDRFWAAYGRFHDPSHQVQPVPSPLALMYYV